MGPTWAEIDLDAISGNLRVVRQLLHPTCRLLAVVKADAYGHGALEVGRALVAAGADGLGVSTVAEGLALRSAGVAGPILAFTPPRGEDIAPALAAGLSLTAVSPECARRIATEADQAGCPATVHLKCDTGMGRYGIAAADLGAVAAEGPVPFAVGLGQDIHRLVPGRRLVLGGVEVPFERGLLGHSDADVLSHALADAVLGAAALGDIGRHFPPADPAYAGADSLVLLARCRELAAAAGWCPWQVDCLVIAEEPRLSPHVERIRAKLAEVLGVAPARVNVKAGTNEGLGSLGRGEGIAAQAVVLAVRCAARGLV